MELVYLWVEDYKNIHQQGFIDAIMTLTGGVQHLYVRRVLR
jgi:hypothetical protein